MKLINTYTQYDII